MPFKKRQFHRRKASAKPTKAVRRYVAKAIHRNAENKFTTQLLNQVGTFQGVGNGWIENDLTNISQGNTVSTRIGNQLKVRGFALHGTVCGGQSNSATDDSRNTIRIILALWDTASATPLYTNGALIDSYITPETAQGKGLVKKYFDTCINLTTSGRDTVGYLPALRRVHKFIKCHPTIRYSATSGSSAQRKLILSMISDSSAIPNPGFTQGSFQLFFEDA